MSPQEALAVVLALAYLVLAIRENRWCWPAGIGSSLLYLAVFYDAALYMEAGLQLFYVAMAVYGWRAWRPAQGQSPGQGAPSAGSAALAIHRWPLRWHGVAVAVIAALSLASGWLLDRYTPAAAPYLDSFVTWSAVLTTWMVARKVLENWLYWFVIDSVTLGLALQRGLYLTAALFLLYLALVVIGWRAWFARWQGTAAPKALQDA
jgi:nicotinamide mononucleotide transporter